MEAPQEMSKVFVKTLREKRLKFMSGFKSSNIQEPNLKHLVYNLILKCLKLKLLFNYNLWTRSDPD